MISAEYAIQRFRRDLTVGTVLRVALLTAAGFCIVGPLLGVGFNATLALVVIGVVWAVLTQRSARGSVLAANSPLLIASGRFEEAEHQIDSALRSFSMFKTSKLLSLHHLAVLRHAQRRWGDCASLCRAVLGQRLGSLNGLNRPSRLILTDALLELGDLRGAYETMNGLYSQRLTLLEAVNLLGLQLDYCSRIGAWEPMMANVWTKIHLAELMPTSSSARAQAFLALAARRTGREDWAKWLSRRAELLESPAKLREERPVLSELWPA